MKSLYKLRLTSVAIAFMGVLAAGCEKDFLVEK